MTRTEDPCLLSSTAHTMPEYQRRLAIATAIVDRMKLDRITGALLREDQEKIIEFYHDIQYQRSHMEPSSKATTSKEGFRKWLSRRRIGLTVREIAEKQNLRRSTLVSLLVHHGFLELSPYGGTQNRMLVTKTAFDGEFGHNVLPENRIGHLEGYHRSCVFPVFYPERLTDLLWCLDYDGIKRGVSDQVSKKKQLAWLLKYHPHLPNDELAELASYSLSGIEKARSKATAFG